MDQNAASLGLKARQLIDDPDSDSHIAVSAISFWEIAMLQAKRRVQFLTPLTDWRLGLIASGIIEIPITGAIGIQAGDLEDLHGDPADRIIMATAIQLEASLLTADRAMLEWSGDLVRLDASK